MTEYSPTLESANGRVPGIKDVRRLVEAAQQPGDMSHELFESAVNVNGETARLVAAMRDSSELSPETHKYLVALEDARRELFETGAYSEGYRSATEGFFAKKKIDKRAFITAVVACNLQLADTYINHLRHETEREEDRARRAPLTTTLYTLFEAAGKVSSTDFRVITEQLAPSEVTERDKAGKPLATQPTGRWSREDVRHSFADLIGAGHLKAVNEDSERFYEFQEPTE